MTVTHKFDVYEILRRHLQPPEYFRVILVPPLDLPYYASSQLQH